MVHILSKLGIAALAVLTTLGAVLVIVFSFIQPLQGSALWIGGRLLVAAYVVAMGVLTALHLRVDTASWFRTQLLLLGAIGLTALGAAGAVWGNHLAEVTGDLEAWAITINLLMTAQGAATIWYLWTTHTLLLRSTA